MQLGIFDFIDQVMEQVNINSYIYDIGEREISSYFEDLFYNEDYFLNINSRVKTPSSVKAKILRQNLYVEDWDVDGFLADLPDMIGVRIECRFIPNERLVYDKIVQTFAVRVEEGYFKSANNDKIVLKLDDPQPQIQKNGLDIYKIDGYFIENGGKYNFELQIKSLVNNFWGDIEHKILYKNYSYLLGEDFIVSMMNSINESLSLIDRQLRVVYDHVYTSYQKRSSLEQIKEVFKKVIYDKYFQEIREELGFVVDFKPLVELIVDYIFYNVEKIKYDEFGVRILQILNNVNRVSEKSPKYNQRINFDFEVEFEDPYCQQVADHIKSLVNKDFRWNLLFKIIFEIIERDNTKIFRRFVRYLVDKFVSIADRVVADTRFDEEARAEVKGFTLKCLIESLYKIPNLDSYSDKYFKELEFKLNYYLRDISSYQSFLDCREDLRLIISELI